MAHQRAQSTAATLGGGPHALSLKVLRLSRPSLATQTPLPQTHFGHGLDIPAQASLAYPSADERTTFPLAPVLTLPSAFGAAYVGETFACTLCINNELGEDEKRSVSGVRIVAELQTPGEQNGIALQLSKSDDAAEADAGLPPGTTLQRILRHELKEEGPHVLAVTVSYSETLRDGAGGASGGRARSFRKLYQFVAQQLVAVRSKITERKRREKGMKRQWILEAQLENVGEASAVLERIWLTEREGITSRSVNGEGSREAVVLKPQDIEQVMFELEGDEKVEGMGNRVPLAQLNIDWRTAMGERGRLTTGTLAARGR